MRFSKASLEVFASPSNRVRKTPMMLSML